MDLDSTYKTYLDLQRFLRNIYDVKESMEYYSCPDRGENPIPIRIEPEGATGFDGCVRCGGICIEGYL